MVLRKLSIFGFKSFAEKTELRFGEGMTAVVGPNGCGKSNVVDAIRWVFGEQKASVLRTENMSDVIFSGTQRRSALNMAEVTLVIENSRGVLPVEFQEVAITRRVFRSGESEYLINRAPSRLRDIHNMFIDTGVGSSAYTTIEKGMIDRILSDKTEERRTLFEEAAGIGKYKQQIRESERKLDRTRQDLLRINDRVQEKTRFVNMLSRQVEKAHRYKQYFDDLKSLEVGFENRRFQNLSQAIAVRTTDMADQDTGIETLRARIAEQESRIEQMEIAKVEKETEVQIAGRNVADIGEKINAADREVGNARQTVEFLRGNIARFEQEIDTFETQRSEKASLLSGIERSIVEREAQLIEFNERVDGARAELGSFDSRVGGQREKVEDLAAQQLELVNQAGRSQIDLNNARTALASCIERVERDGGELHAMEERLAEYQDRLETSRAKLEGAGDTLRTHMQTRDVLRSRIDKEEEKYHTLVENEKRLEAQIDSAKAKQRFLEGLNASFEGFGPGVKHLLQKRPAGLKGIAADFIRIDDQQLLAAAEKALGDAIQTLVFENDATMLAAIENLTSEKAGTALMVSLEGLSRNASSASIAGASALRGSVRTTDGFEALADQLFSDIYVSDSTEAALAARRTLPSGGLVVSRVDGTVCRASGLVAAGAQKKEQTGLLQRRQEIERLIAEADTLKTDYDRVVGEKEICIINRDEAKMALIEIDDKLNLGRQQQQEYETNIRHYDREIHNVNDRISAILPELTKNRESIRTFEARIAECEAALADVTSHRQDLEGQISSARGRLTEMDSERAALAEQLRTMDLSRHGIMNRLEQDRKSIEQLSRDLSQFGQGRQQKFEDKQRAEAQIAENESRVQLLGESLARLNAQRDELRAGLDAVREEYNVLVRTVEESRRTVKVSQQELEGLSGRRYGLEVAQTRDEEQRKAIRERIFTEYEIDLQSPSEELPVVDMEDADAVSNITMLRERLKRVGEVNMGAIAEYEKENGELHEMTTQRDDLQAAVDDLERAIKKLNREARVKFVETFEQVKIHFNEMYSTLFEGGEAVLELEEGVDPLDAAIKIDARPAGKKMRGLTALSSGERALTSISLLFALYLVKPSAYCILDELDGPLDDANVRRFVNLLHKFAEKTQFIVITHRKLTMEAADLLYGVTQQESGVSTVASVQLGEVVQEAKAA